MNTQPMTIKSLYKLLIASQNGNERLKKQMKQLKEEKQAKIVTITCLELKEIGYPIKDARALIIELSAHMPYIMKSRYIKVTRNGKEQDHLQALKTFDADDIIASCDYKIGRKDEVKRINHKKWEILKANIIQYKGEKDE